MAERKKQTRKPIAPQKQRAASLKYLYGLTVEEWNHMLIDQAGRCALCDAPMKDPHVDHSHITGEVRGLLCLQCNTMLGRVERLGLPGIEVYLGSHRRAIAMETDPSFVQEFRGTPDLDSRKVRMNIGDKVTVKTGTLAGTQVTIARMDGCYIRLPDGTSRWMAATNLAPITVVTPPPVTPPPPTNPLLAPITDLSLVEGRLTWSKRTGAPGYEVATVIPGRDTTYIKIPGTISGDKVLYTLPPQVNLTAEYGVRVDVEGSEWHKDELRVKKTWPPAPQPEPGSGPSIPAGNILLGITGGGAHSSPDSWMEGEKLGAKRMRLEFGIGTSVAELRPIVARFADKGIKILPLAGFHNRLPTVAEAQNLANWAKEFGPGGAFWINRSDGSRMAWDKIEFGNETSYTYQRGPGIGGELAQRLRDAAKAIWAAGFKGKVGLVMQGDQNQTYIDSMFNAVPELMDYVHSWALHPYGPESRCDRILNDFRNNLKKRTSVVRPWQLTELGIATDDGRRLDGNYDWDPAMTWATAGKEIVNTFARLETKFPEVDEAYIYQGSDQGVHNVDAPTREKWFGALQRNLTDKGDYSKAVRGLLARG